MACLKRPFVCALIFLSALPLINCHFFAMRFFRQLIPSKRVSNATIGTAEAPSVINCNLKCLNKKPCISTLFTISKKKCFLLKSFFEEVKDFGETNEHDKSAKVIESRFMELPMPKKEQKEDTTSLVPPVVPTIETCYGNFTGPSGNVTSPGHPNNYRRNTICTYSITVQAGMTVKLVFKSFSLEANRACVFDSVQIIDGSTRRTYCGGVLPPPYQSKNNSLIVKFVSDSSVVSTGFYLQYQALPYQGLNCLDIKRKNENSTSGYYYVWLHASETATIRVYCDMQTDGGGWTQVLHVKSNTDSMSEFLALPFQKWTTLEGFNASGNYVILPTTLRNSSLLSTVPQLRFKCRLPQKEKSFDVMTTKNATGKAVVDWFTARSDVKPAACGSYQRLADDYSYSASRCSQWGGANNWGMNRKVDDRFINHAMYISGHAHWNLFCSLSIPNRFECDNHRSQIIKKDEEWNIFVR